MCQVPKIQFADLLELIVRTGALDVDYLRPKKQPPADGLGRGRVTEYEVLCDAIKSELLSIDDKGAGAQNASLDFGEFLEFVSVSVLGLRSDAVFMKTSTRCHVAATPSS